MARLPACLFLRHASDVPVRAGQPVAEVRGGFIGRLAIEGHQRGRDTGNAGDLRAPPVVGDASDFDHVLTSRDHGFDTLTSHGRAL